MIWMFSNFFLSVMNKTMLSKVSQSHDFPFNDSTSNLETEIVKFLKLEGRVLSLSMEYGEC